MILPLALVVISICSSAEVFILFQSSLFLPVIVSLLPKLSFGSGVVGTSFLISKGGSAVR